MTHAATISRRYGLVALTSGFYALFWALELMRNVNRISGKELFTVGVWRRVVVVAVSVSGFFLLFLFRNFGVESQFSLLPVALVFAFGLNTLLIVMVLRVNAAIRRLAPSKARKSVVIGAMTLCFALSLALLHATVAEIESRPIGDAVSS